MSTTVAYYDGKPAINVKDRHSGQDFVIALQRLVSDPAVVLGESKNCQYPTDLRDIAYERVVSDFWQQADQIATERGLGDIVQEGRSGGWLVFTSYDPTYGGSEDPGDMDSHWLAGYQSIRDWAEAFIADSPDKVASLAQQIAMDELGRPAAERMFGR